MATFLTTVSHFNLKKMCAKNQAFCDTSICDRRMPSHGEEDARIMACLVAARMDPGDEKKMERCGKMTKGEDKEEL